MFARQNLELRHSVSTRALQQLYDWADYSDATRWSIVGEKHHESFNLGLMFVNTVVSSFKGERTRLKAQVAEIRFPQGVDGLCFVIG